VALLLAALTMAPACDRNTKALSDSLDAAGVPEAYDSVGDYPSGSVVPILGEQSLGVTRVYLSSKPFEQVCEDLAAIINRLGPITTDPPRVIQHAGGRLTCMATGTMNDSDYSYAGQVFTREDYLRLYDGDDEVPSQVISEVGDSTGVVLLLSARVRD
jgi:hypothetical protein